MPLLIFTAQAIVTCYNVGPSCAFACLRARAARPAHADSGSGAKHKHMCVAMAPTITMTSEPICCVTMETVISQRVGGIEAEGGRERVVGFKEKGCHN